jgi:hypothetical protein
MKKKEFLTIILLLVLTIPSVLPLFHPGFFQTDDGEWMIIRLSAFYQALHDGQFPVRFLQRLNAGYGYPVAEFLYPGAFYLGTFLHVIRFGFVNSIKIVFGLSLIGSAVFTYFWLRKLFSQFSSFVGALFALYLPYHLYDVYTRGSLEVFAMLWMPFIFWQIERRSFFFTTLGIALLIISHNTLAALFFPLIVCYMVKKFYMSKRRPQTLYYYIYTLLISLGLSAFFWLPIPFELRDTVFSSTTVSQWNNYFATFGQIGIVSFVVLLGVLFLFITQKADVKKHRLTVLFFIFSAVSIFLSTKISFQIWNIMPVSFIQFPFRLLSIIIVTIPFLAAFIISVFKNKTQVIFGIVLLLLLGYCALPFSKPALYFDKGEGYYYTNDATTTVQDEYMPLWVRQKPMSSPSQKVVIIKGAGSIENVDPTNNSLTFSADLIKSSTIQVNTIYWPGWEATVDGKPVSFSYDNPKGVMMLIVPKGENIVQFVFREDPLRLASDLLSFFALIVLFIFTLQYNKRK